MNLYFLAEISIAFIPVLLFLGALMLFDSFKLVNFRSILFMLLTGFAAAIVSMFLNQILISQTGLPSREYSRIIAPTVEELFKVAPVFYLIAAKKVGFKIDAAILGFAAGTGFAIIENIYYMQNLQNAALLTWFVRGFGTAVMHGGTVVIAAIFMKDLSDRKNWHNLFYYISGLSVAILIHSLYNQFLLPPVNMTLFILLTFPPLIYFVFKKSIQNTRNWLGTGLDNDMDILRIIMAGNISKTRVGQYLESVQDKFEAEIVGDIICYLRTYLELSIKAKGIMILKENGFESPPDPEINAQFDELEYLGKNIGTTGKIAIEPLLNLSNTDLWQLHMLQKGSKK